MPCRISAPIISAITGFDGMPSVSIGMNEVCAPALFAASGAATPSIAPLPNSRRVARHLLLQRVRRERGEHRAAAGQDAEERAERGAAQDRRDHALEVLARRHQAGRSSSTTSERVASFSQVGDDLAEPEHAHRDDDEVDAVGQLRQAEREARDARVDVGADRSRAAGRAGSWRSRAAASRWPARSTRPGRAPSARSIRPGPNFSATSASGGATSAIRKVQTVPAKNDPIAAVASATPARPLRAIW